MEVVPLFSKVYGEGAPLIILHGLFGMGDNWATHAKHWAGLDWEVHAVDQCLPRLECHEAFGKSS